MASASSVPQSDADRALASLLTSVLPAVQVQLGRAVWDGFIVAEPEAPDVQRSRLVHVARLRVKDSGREYNVSAHLFTNVGVETAPHDHRYPLAVFPFSVPTSSGAGDHGRALYEMHWTNLSAATSALVRVASGDVWAIAQPTSVQHTVRSLVPHASIILADVTDPPTRPDRLVTSSLAPEAITRVRETLRAALAAALGGAASGDHDFERGRCGGADVED